MTFRQLSGVIKKADLYSSVDSVIDFLQIRAPFNSIDVARRLKIDIIYAPFKTKALGGALINACSPAVIILNSNRTEKAQNHDCMHEMMHYFFHPVKEIALSYDGVTQCRSRIEEMQANEGAAQALMPWQQFVPDCVNASGDVPLLSQKYGVTESSVKWRITNLWREIRAFDVHRDIQRIHIQNFSKSDLRLIEQKLPFTFEAPTIGGYY